MRSEEAMKDLVMLASKADLARLPPEHRMRIHSEALKVAKALNEYKEVTSMLVLVAGTNENGDHTANVSVVGLPTSLIFGMDYLIMNHKEVLTQAGACPCPTHKLQLLLSLMASIEEMEAKGLDADKPYARPM